MIPKLFPSPPTPERCLKALTTSSFQPTLPDGLSPPELTSPGSSLSSSSTFVSTSGPSPVWSPPDPATLPLSLSAQPSPALERSSPTAPTAAPTAARPGLGPRKLTKEDFGGSASKLARELLRQSRPEVVGLRVEDRVAMEALMSMGAGRRACEMASEVLSIILPALPKDQGFTVKQRRHASRQQELTVSQAIRRWMSLAPHPLIVLIATVILLERLVANYPQLGRAGTVNTPDAVLRVTFASFLVAFKETCDVSYLNSSFVKYTPWRLRDLNRMEKEFLGCLQWDVFISHKEILHRASGFYPLTPSPPSDPSEPPDPVAQPQGNLFLMRRRPDPSLTRPEPSWRGGLMTRAGEVGHRMTHSVTSPQGGGGAQDLEGVVGRERERDGGGGGQGREAEGETVWVGGRLERTGEAGLGERGGGGGSVEEGDGESESETDESETGEEDEEAGR